MHENTFVMVSVDGYDFHQLFRNYCFVLIEELSLKSENLKNEDRYQSYTKEEEDCGTVEYFQKYDTNS